MVGCRGFKARGSKTPGQYWTNSVVCHCVMFRYMCIPVGVVCVHTFVTYLMDRPRTCRGTQRRSCWWEVLPEGLTGSQDVSSYLQIQVSETLHRYNLSWCNFHPINLLNQTIYIWQKRTRIWEKQEISLYTVCNSFSMTLSMNRKTPLYHQKYFLYYWCWLNRQEPDCGILACLLPMCSKAGCVTFDKKTIMFTLDIGL